MVRPRRMGYLRGNHLVSIPTFENFDTLNAYLELECARRPGVRSKGRGFTGRRTMAAGPLLYYRPSSHHSSFADNAKLEERRGKEGMKKCPLYADQVKQDAIVRRYCQRDLLNPSIGRSEFFLSRVTAHLDVHTVVKSGCQLAKPRSERPQEQPDCPLREPNLTNAFRRS